MRPDEYVISADEKTQLQALGREHPTVAPGPGRRGLLEFEYVRGGTLANLAAWDVHHANLFDRVEQTTGTVPFGPLVDQVMTVEPYRSAKTVYWVVDNGSSHTGKTSVKRMADKYPNAKALPQHHPPVRVDLHPRQAQRRHREDHPPRASTSRARRMNRITYGRLH